MTNALALGTRGWGYGGFVIIDRDGGAHIKVSSELGQHEGGTRSIFLESWPDGVHGFEEGLHPPISKPSEDYIPLVLHDQPAPAGPRVRDLKKGAGGWITPWALVRLMNDRFGIMRDTLIHEGESDFASVYIEYRPNGLHVWVEHATQPFRTEGSFPEIDINLTLIISVYYDGLTTLYNDPPNL